MDRVILHVDMNAFYASVESLTHPEARDRPMAVCGDIENRRGIILAKNELAKKCGVKTAEPIWQAEKKCPGLLLLPPHHDLYQTYSQRANGIYRRFTDLVEPASIDESYLDVTGSRALFGTGGEIADTIRETVRSELGLTVSVGVSFCKVFAKLGSDYKKPDATTVISRDNYQEILYPLPVTDLMYVGGATARSLEAIGVKTIGALAALDERTLVSRFGKHGHTLYTYAHGLDREPVKRPEERDEVKSVGNSITFKRNLISLEDIRAGLLPLAESVGERLRSHGLRCGGVQISIKDPAFKTIDRQMQLPHPTHATREIYEAALELVRHSWKIGNPIRLLNVTAIHLSEGESGQISLFDQLTDKRLEALDSSLDKIRAKYGKGVIKPASILKNDLGIDQ